MVLRRCIFQTFLHACLLDRTANAFAVETGLFGDLIGNLQRHADRKVEKAVVVIEWSDLDARLGFRVTHGWREEHLADISATVAARLEQLTEQLSALAKAPSIVAVALPTLPLPPLTHHSPINGSSICFDVWRQLNQFSADLTAAEADIRVLSPQQIDLLSPAGERYDIRGDLSSGFPYHQQHAYHLANNLAELLLPTPPLKGLITDLDNTFWRGILGEDGLDGIHWNLNQAAHGHGLYQEMLQSLAESGILIAVASKNDESLVKQALLRGDLVVDVSKIFPIESHWGPKSESVNRILDAWNIGAASVTFIDDSPMEIAEVQTAFPDMKCRLFPTKDDRATLELLTSLRGQYGKTHISDEDRIRSASLRSTRQRSIEATGTAPDQFLARADAQLEFEFNRPDDRSLELINKTNQFNINGRRLDDAEWRQRVNNSSNFLVAVSYKDKFGPLGKISVVVGQTGAIPVIETWVMSCRAFSRRIEHHILQVLFNRLACEQIRLDFHSTDRNGPAQAFLEEMAGQAIDSCFTLSKSTFEKNCPQTFGTESIQ